MGLSFRTYSPPLLHSLVSFWNLAFRDRRSFYPVTEEQYRSRILAQEIFDPLGLILAVEEGRVLGMAHAFRPLPSGPFIYSRERCRDNASIGVLAVLPERRGRGIGGELLARAEAYVQPQLAPGHRIFAGDYYVPLYNALEGPRQPFWGDAEFIGISERDKAVIEFLSHRGYASTDRPGQEVTMERRLFEPPPPAVPVPLESLGLREVLVTEALPWEGRIAWYPKEERGYVHGRFGNYSHHVLALARGDAITAHLEWYPMREAGRAALWDLRVAEEDRGKGLGRYLLDKYLRLVWDQGFRIVELHTNTHNNALALRMYQERGFRIVERWVTLQKTIV